MSLVHETTEESGRVCILCKNRYSSQSNLNRHLSEKHSLPSEVVIYDKHVKSFKCLEGCNLSFHHRSGLVHHLKHIHKISVEQEEKQFGSRDEFLEWLKFLEKSNNVQYVRQSIKTQLDTIRIYYKCSRSGKSNPKKVLKQKRSSKKMSTPCTSAIELVETKSNGLKIKFYKTHYGHDFQIRHLHLLKEERMYVAQKLIDGLSPTEILDAIKTSADPTKSRRIDFLTKTDIRNIKKNIKKWCSLDTQQIKYDMRSETSSDMCDNQMDNFESVELELSKGHDESLTESHAVPQIGCQNSHTEDEVCKSMAKLDETKHSCFSEMERLKHNIEQVSNTQKLEQVLEQLWRLNSLLEPESRGRKTSEFASHCITDQFVSPNTETFVIQHDHGYT